MRAGQKDDTGRTLDIIFNFYIYSGPIIGGVSLYDHLINFTSFENAGVMLFSSIPEFDRNHYHRAENGHSIRHTAQEGR